jgi:hypothetical protein
MNRHGAIFLDPKCQVLQAPAVFSLIFLDTISKKPEMNVE